MTAPLILNNYLIIVFQQTNSHTCHKAKKITHASMRYSPITLTSVSKLTPAKA